MVSTIDNASGVKLSAFSWRGYYVFKWILKWFSCICKTSFAWVILLLTLSFITIYFFRDFFPRFRTILNKLLESLLLNSLSSCIISFSNKLLFSLDCCLACSIFDFTVFFQKLVFWSLEYQSFSFLIFFLPHIIVQ